MPDRTVVTLAETDFIQQQRVAHLATSDKQGNPHVIPVCFAFDGTHFFIALDEKPKRVKVQQLRRVRNILERPTIALVIDQYADDWSQLGYVLIRGEATLIEAQHSHHALALLLLRERYVQYQTMALEQAPIIQITPRQVTTWGVAAESKANE